MTQTSNRILDEFARLMTDAAGVAKGVRSEAETVFRTQAEKVLRDLDVVQREEFEAVKEMAAKARAEADDLKARIEALEAAGAPAAARKKPASSKKAASPKKTAASAAKSSGSAS